MAIYDTDELSRYTQTIATKAMELETLEGNSVWPMRFQVTSLELRRQPRASSDTVLDTNRYRNLSRSRSYFVNWKRSQKKHLSQDGRRQTSHSTCCSNSAMLGSLPPFAALGTKGGSWRTPADDRAFEAKAGIGEVGERQESRVSRRPGSRERNRITLERISELGGSSDIAIDTARWSSCTTDVCAIFRSVTRAHSHRASTTVVHKATMLRIS